MADRQHAWPQIEMLRVVRCHEPKLLERMQAAPCRGTRNAGPMTDLCDRHPALLVRQREQHSQPACERGHEIGIVREACDRLCGHHIGIEEWSRNDGHKGRDTHTLGGHYFGKSQTTGHGSLLQAWGLRKADTPIRIATISYMKLPAKLSLNPSCRQMWARSAQDGAVRP